MAESRLSSKRHLKSFRIGVNLAVGLSLRQVSTSLVSLLVKAYSCIFVNENDEVTMQ